MTFYSFFLEPVWDANYLWLLKMRNTFLFPAVWSNWTFCNGWRKILGFCSPKRDCMLECEIIAVYSWIVFGLSYFQQMWTAFSDVLNWLGVQSDNLFSSQSALTICLVLTSYSLIVSKVVKSPMKPLASLFLSFIFKAPRRYWIQVNHADLLPTGTGSLG